MKIFWSWQSDRIPKNHHRFVRDALEKACELIAAQAEVDESERPEVDHDTKGVAGTPDIVRAIAEKIDVAAAFVADMTPVAVTNPAALRPDLQPEKLPKSKHVQNANVMSELGYAEKSIGLERIILVANAAHYPGPDALPFDWRNRRGPITFNLPDNATKEDRASAGDALAKALKEPLQLILGSRARSTSAPSFQEASALDPAIWPAAEDGFKMRNLFTPSRKHTYSLPQSGRLFVRMIPTSWTAPSSAVLTERLRKSGLAFYTGGQHGNTGPNREGALSIWGVTSMDTEGIDAKTVTQWFRSSGELWGVDAGTFYDGKDEGASFAAEYAMPRIAMFLREGAAAILEFGQGPIHAQIGALGLGGTNWPIGRLFAENHAALDNEAIVIGVLSPGSDEDRHQLLLRFWNKLRDVYSLPHAEDVAALETQAKLTLTKHAA